jgi:hypothetical protein
MPDIVTFDGPAKVITEIAGGTENELDVIEVYSEWKVWTMLSDNLKFLHAFGVVGGDPITPTQNLGSTFFMENGWRIRPAELDHKLTLVGNIFTREPGESVFLATLGAFTVNTETRVSSLVDSSVARLDLAQLLQAIYVSVDGVAGTAEGVGTPTNPVDNIPDARLIADRENLHGYNVRGSFTLSEDHEFWAFEGSAATFADILNLGGFSVESSRFSNVTLTGAMSGAIEAVECVMEILTGLDGILRRCGLNQDITLAAAAEALLESCYSMVPGTTTPRIFYAANSDLNMRDFSGGIELRDMTTGCTSSIDLDPGHLVIDSSCTGGIVLVRGLGRITDNSAGAVTVLDFGFLSAEEMQITYHAIAGNATVSLDDQTVTIKDESGATIRVLSVSVDGRVRTIVS